MTLRSKIQWTPCLRKKKNKVRRGWMRGCILTNSATQEQDKTHRKHHKHRRHHHHHHHHHHQQPEEQQKKTKERYPTFAGEVACDDGAAPAKKQRRRRRPRSLYLHKFSCCMTPVSGLADMVETRAQKVVKHVVLQSDDLLMQDTSSQG